MFTRRLFSTHALRRRGIRRLSTAISVATLFALLAVLVSACAPAATSIPSTSDASTSVPVTRIAEATVVLREEILAAPTIIAAAQAPVPGTPCCSTGGNTTVNGEPYDATFFENYGTNPFIDTEDDHLSTFALDVDTASYTVIRRFLHDGNWPDKDAVRVEEVINYFDWRYADPEEGAFSLHLEGAPSPFGGDKYWLVKIGVQGRHINTEQRQDAMLTFVIDVSGSMAAENRLGMVKRALHLLVNELRSSDRVAIVVYGSDARMVLPPTRASNSETILEAIDRLEPEGATNAAAGLQMAYQVASEAYREGEINRLILCSDGVANVGVTGADEILATIERFARRNIALSTVGFGMGNFNDVMMEQLADKGNGNYAYVDTLEEARRIFVENLTGTLQTIARDAKMQVEFNPQVVSRYRLLGYENRDVADQDFRNDKVDAGEVGAGHSVTALYEIKFHDGAPPADQALMARIRYQDPTSGEVVEQDAALAGEDFQARFEAASPMFQLAAAVAEYAEILRQSYWSKESRMSDVQALVRRLTDDLPQDEQVNDFLDLVNRAAALQR
ncbi:MAG: von Willebrand factor type A domain-containing protein [Anaerolineae bacterium]